jgi:4a-hydroxytetrahydrobiopterin dehydratase
MALDLADVTARTAPVTVPSADRPMANANPAAEHGGTPRAGALRRPAGDLDHAQHQLERGRSPVIAHREFLAAVADRAALDRPDSAKRPAESVLVGVARRLDDNGRETLESTLPSQLATLVHESAPLHHDEGKAPFLRTVASELDVSPERARLFAQAVLSTLGDQDGATTETVRSQMPEDVLDLFAAPDGGETGRSATAALPEPTDLTDEEVAAELRKLPGWTGDARAIERVVALAPGIGQELRDRISRVEQAMNHHAVEEERADGTALRIWTHSRGVVTDLDIELARRINEIIDA